MIDPTASLIDVYDHIALQYIEHYAGDSSDIPHIDEFLSKVKPGGFVLDAGCGAGSHAGYMAKKGFDVVGIDVSQSMLKIARKNHPACTFLTMSIADIQFPANRFDGIISSYSLIHIPDENISKVLSSFYRILKRDGWLTIFAQMGKKDHYVDEPMARGKKTFFNFFTPEDIEQKLTKAGFSSVSIKRQSCDDPYNMSDTNLYILAKK